MNNGLRLESSENLASIIVILMSYLWFGEIE